METSRDSRGSTGPQSPGPLPGQMQHSQPLGGALLARPARGFVRFLYSSNPFYILSADLVFVGLRISFGAGGPAPSTWALVMGLAGYTLLMATTACFLIRVGKLWDDLRSLLLLIVMMFLAMATERRRHHGGRPAPGAIGYLGGFLFAVVVTEIVLRTIRLRLPGWYRAAYYADSRPGVSLPDRAGPVPERPGESAVAVGAFWLFTAGGAGSVAAGAGGARRGRPTSPGTAVRGDGRFIRGRSSL